MPRILSNPPNWGYDIDYMKKYNYENVMKNDLSYIDVVRMYSLYSYTCFNGYGQTFVLLDHTNYVLKYKSVIMDANFNNKYMQSFVWRDLTDKSLKGIASQLITEYYVDIFEKLYSDDTQTIAGKKLWQNMFDRNNSLNFGSYNIELDNHESINDFESLYKGPSHSDVILYVSR